MREQLKAVSQEFGIPLEDWLDLSSRINLNSNPLPYMPSNVRQRLPERNDGLAQTVKDLTGQRSLRLVELLEEMIFNKPLINGGVYFNTTNQHVHSTKQFAYFEHPRALFIYQQLAKQGVLVRPFNNPPVLCFGLPADEKGWQYLVGALNRIKL